MASGFAEKLKKGVMENWKQYVLAFISIAVFLAAWQLYSSYLHEDLKILLILCTGFSDLDLAMSF